MSDYTFDAMPPQRDARRASERREYAAYFTLIFVLALPFAVVAWGFGALRHARVPEVGPIRLALTQAGTIAPLIFSA